MITMDVKGITWVGNIYKKFENMCLEAEDIICEDAVKYIENQMQTVGTNVKKLYSDVMRDFIPPCSYDLDEKVASGPVDQYIDAWLYERPFQSLKEKPMKEDFKQKKYDSGIHHDSNNDTIRAASDDGTCLSDAMFISSSRSSVRRRNIISHSRHYVETTNIKSNIRIDGNQEIKRVVASKKFDKTTLAETNACRATQSCETSNEDISPAVGDSKPPSSEVTRCSSIADSCIEIENASSEQSPNVPEFTKSGFSSDRTIQADDCSSSMVVISHPGHKTMQQDHLNVEETCVMVTGDELKLIPKVGDSSKTNKKSRRRVFSLAKKSARKQEYEELAAWHGNGEKLNGDCVEKLDLDPLPSISEPEWELL
ncbi:uncharacterized protein LOC107478049 [Arachis duranensis]|uniref:Uncharacterized protein LOC107478049 n=1 Tax=Arachis duranensis TaxID=130453 RepID=A0A6P4CNA8_ARADU|nr:uncharacterized protein LOC107478049 [Arachis duranensis]